MANYVDNNLHISNISSEEAGCLITAVDSDAFLQNLAPQPHWMIRIEEDGPYSLCFADDGFSTVNSVPGGQEHLEWMEPKTRSEPIFQGALK